MNHVKTKNNGCEIDAKAMTINYPNNNNTCAISDKKPSKYLKRFGIVCAYIWDYFQLG